MPAQSHRNRLLAWFVGLVIIIVAIGITGYQMLATNCPVTFPILLLVLGVVPIVYLVLMYLTLISQD